MMFKNKKIVISASSNFTNEVKGLVTSFKEKENDVLEYVKDNDREYKDVLYNFYTAIDNADVLFVYNKEKKGINGYIGTSVFSEINHAAINNIVHNKNIDIYLFNDIDENSMCYDELKYYLDIGMIKVLSDKEKESLYM